MIIQNFKFKFKLSSLFEELKIVDKKIDMKEIKQLIQKTYYAFVNNRDKKDPEYILLYDDILRCLKKLHIKPVGLIEKIKDIFSKIDKRNVEDEKISSLYNNDEKYMRIHKKIIKERNDKNKFTVFKDETKLISFLTISKKNIDQKIYNANDVLKNTDFFEKIIKNEIVSNVDKLSLNLSEEDQEFIKKELAEQYRNEYNNQYKKEKYDVNNRYKTQLLTN